GCSEPFVASPSIVVISWPSAWTPRTVHDFTDSPSMSTVHAPHDDVSQPTFVPVSPSRSRRTYTRSSRGSRSRSCSAPLTVIETRATTSSFPPRGTRGEHTPPARAVPQPLAAALDRAFHVPLGLALREVAALVPQLLPAGKRKLDLRATVAEVELRWDEGEPTLPHLARQRVDLLAPE